MRMPWTRQSGNDGASSATRAMRSGLVTATEVSGILRLDTLSLKELEQGYRLRLSRSLHEEGVLLFYIRRGVGIRATA